MTQATDIRTGRHCVFLMHAHLVFVTKYRKTIFTQNHFKTMKDIFEKICNDFEVTLVEFDGEKDHVHLLINYPPKVSISKLVNSLKGVSSRKLRQQHKDVLKYYWKGVLWSPSYFSGSCGGAPITVIRKYIEQQQSPH
ncbi:IS200/IS605 family transposase [Thiotrichales bacterium 19S11-10]|nr:IS200/IS605 family transposase [Thiotrichales bacterium 19S11-10]